MISNYEALKRFLQTQLLDKGLEFNPLKTTKSAPAALLRGFREKAGQPSASSTGVNQLTATRLLTRQDPEYLTSSAERCTGTLSTLKLSAAGSTSPNECSILLGYQPRLARTLPEMSFK